MYFSLFIAFLVVLSTVAVVIESMPMFYRQRNMTWFYGEIVVMSIFSSEFLARVYAHSKTWKEFRRFFFSFLTFADLLSIFPYYIEWVIVREHFGEFQRLTVFRLFRLFRLLRCFSYSDVLQMSYDAFVIALKRSRDTLAAIAAFQSLLIIIFSTLLYFAERGEWDPQKRVFLDVDGQRSRFDSIPATFWFVAQVITTVGLGDMYPKTALGKFISFPLMLFGLLIIALPSIVLGRNFSEAWHWLKCLPADVRRRIHMVSLPDPLPDMRKHRHPAPSTADTFHALTPAQQVEMYTMLRQMTSEVTRQNLRSRRHNY